MDRRIDGQTISLSRAKITHMVVFIENAHKQKEMSYHQHEPLWFYLKACNEKWNLTIKQTHQWWESAKACSYLKQLSLCLNNNHHKSYNLCGIPANILDAVSDVTQHNNKIQSRDQLIF